MVKFIQFAVGVLVGFAVALACNSVADSSVAISAPLVQARYEQGVALTVTERVARKYDMHLTLISSQDTNERGHLSANGIVSVQRVVNVSRVELGLGPAVWHHVSAINGCRMGYHLSAAVHASPRVLVRWDHFSNADTCPPNTGHDLIGLEYRF